MSLHAQITTIRRRKTPTRRPNPEKPRRWHFFGNGYAATDDDHGLSIASQLDQCISLFDELNRTAESRAQRAFDFTIASTLLFDRSHRPQLQGAGPHLPSPLPTCSPARDACACAADTVQTAVPHSNGAHDQSSVAHANASRIKSR